jgi:peptide/nickel transport system ATP-binding protein
VNTPDVNRGRHLRHGETLLEVFGLRVAVGSRENPVELVRGVSFEVKAGEIFGLLGESGSGKSVTVQAVNGLLPQGMRVVGGSVRFRGEELIGAKPKRLAELRGDRIGMVFQDSLTSLNPVMRIGPQVAEPLILHGKAKGRQAQTIAAERLQSMGIPDVYEFMRRYPHEFSGGMRQRATIATALIDSPELLIADEPTTALDVTVQAQILDICLRLNRELGVAIILISHDIGVLSQVCTSIGVMYAGQLVQTGPTQSLLDNPTHPYTRALVESMPNVGAHGAVRLKAITGEPPSPAALPTGCKFHPRCRLAIARCREEEPSLLPVGATRSACWVAQSGDLPGWDRTIAAMGTGVRQLSSRQSGSAGDPLLKVSGLRRYFAVQSQTVFGPLRWLHAVDDVSLELAQGDTLGIVGESGCGKSTLARCLLRLTDVDAGRIEFMGQDITRLGGAELRGLRRHMQPVFQDPYSSLNPRWNVADIIAEPLVVHGFPSHEVESRVREALDLVGLGQNIAGRHAHQLSGGQRQRVGIARAIVLRPALIVADEPVSSLDLSIQAQIVNLLHDLQEQFRLTLVFISHDLRVVQQLCSRIAVMFLGQVIESGPTEEVCACPRHPYTRALLSSVPEIGVKEDNRTAVLLPGDPPSPIRPPSGCRFHTRCVCAQTICAQKEPVWTSPDGAGRGWACHFALEFESATLEHSR